MGNGISTQRVVRTEMVRGVTFTVIETIWTAGGASYDVRVEGSSTLLHDESFDEIPDLPQFVADLVANYPDGLDSIVEPEKVKAIIDSLDVAPDAFRVEIRGQYGEPGGSIHLFNGGTETVMWDSAEWEEDPSLVFVIVNAIVRRGVPIAEGD
jgi:hypothetical protein